MDAVLDLFRSGLSIREVSRRTGVCFGTTRNLLVRSGLHRIRHQRIQNGMATCNCCNESKPSEAFPAIDQGKYQCRGCLRAALELYQLRKNGCTSDDYRRMLEAQGGTCAICGATEGHQSKDGTSCRLAVDHDHRTGNVRGLLCNSCNRGLGRFKDSVYLLEAAIRYLKREQSGLRKS